MRKKIENNKCLRVLCFSYHIYIDFMDTITLSQTFNISTNIFLLLVIFGSIISVNYHILVKIHYMLRTGAMTYFLQYVPQEILAMLILFIMSWIICVNIGVVSHCVYKFCIKHSNSCVCDSCWRRKFYETYQKPI